MSETEEIIFGFLLFVVSLSIILIPLFISLRSSKKARTQPPAKPEKLKLSVTVMDMRCGVKMVGIKTPKTVREFWVTFQTEDGRILELPVREGMRLFGNALRIQDIFWTT